MGILHFNESLPIKSNIIRAIVSQKTQVGDAMILKKGNLTVEVIQRNLNISHVGGFGLAGHGCGNVWNVWSQTATFTIPRVILPEL